MIRRCSGILIGLLVLLKPNFGLWPLFLLFTAYRRAAIWSFLSGAFFAVVPVFFYGPTVYREWFASLFHLSGDKHYIFPTNVSVIAAAQSLGHPNVGRVIACAMIAASFYFVARKRPSLVTTSGLALTLGILASPVGWIHYTVFLVPVIFSFRWGWKLACAMLLLLFPAWIACGVVMHHSPQAALLMRCAYMLPIAVLWSGFAHRQFNSEVTY